MTVQLRDVEPQDLALFFEHQRDPVAVEMVMFRSRDRTEFDQHWAKLLADTTNLAKTIVLSAVSAEEHSAGNNAVSAEERVVGNIGSWTSPDGQREVGYWIDRAFWGRGIATQALAAFLRLEPIRPLHAGVAKHNLGSIRVLQKCGFSHVGDDGPTHILLKLDAKL
jgi:RimJ/RimL family protein N-acetyltransferase